MATPPTVQQLQIDVPDQKDASPADWFAPALPDLNKFMGDTQFALQKNLTRADNLASQVYVLNVTTGAAPPYSASFVCTLATQPERIDVVKKMGLKGATFSGATEVANWMLSNSRTSSGATIKINEITGLNPNSSYQITLHVY